MFSQPCSVSSNNRPTKCFEVVSILVDACGGSTEGQNEMISLKIGPNSLKLSSINNVVWPTSNPWLGWATFIAYTNAKITTINNSIKAAGNCGYLKKINPTDIIPSYSKLLIITSEDFDPTVHDFSGLRDTIYVALQNAGNTFGHFGNYKNIRQDYTLIMSTNTCSETVTYARDSMIKVDGTIGGEDGGTVNFTFSGVPTYVNYGCKIPYGNFLISAGSVNPTYCNGSSIVLKGTVQGTDCYYWQVSNKAAGVIADTSNLMTLFNISPGFVGKVKLYLNAWSCGINKDSLIFDILVSNDSIQLNNDTMLCNLTNFQVKAKSTLNNNFSWSHNGKGVLSNNNTLNPIYQPSPNDTGIVVIVLNQTTSCGVLIDSVKIKYISKANANFNLSDTLFCYNGSPISVNLYPNVSGGLFTSNFGIINSNKLTCNDTGLYMVKYIVNAGACVDSVMRYVHVINNSKLTFKASDSLVCLNSLPVKLLPSKQGGFYFSNGHLISNNFIPDSVGVFNVKYKINASTCSDSALLTIRVLPRPNANFNSDSVACVNDPAINFTPVMTGGTFSGVKVKGNSLLTDSAGVFVVKYIISNGYCADSMSKIIHVFPKPKSNFTYSPNLVFVDSVIKFSAIGTSDIVKYNWIFGDNNSLTSKSTDTTYSYQKEGKYYAMLRLINKYGCVDTSTQLINVLLNALLKIPNVFSPNNDNINDNFPGSIVGLQEYKLTIYNRWGGLIYDSNNTDGWDGKYNGVPCDEGVYFYIIDAKSYTNISKTLHGTVTLVR